MQELELLNKIKELRNKNYSRNKICRELNITKDILRKIIEKYKLQKISHVDITGKRFGRLTAIKILNESDICRARKWLCKCDCGNETKVAGTSLRAGDSQSCGCLNKERVAEKARGKRYVYLGKNIRNFNQLYNLYKTRSKRKGFEFSLTKKEFSEIVVKNCFYCNREPFQEMNCGVVDDILKYVGIDRIDNNKGYVLGNVRPACKYCNQAKTNMTEQDFKKWLHLIYHNFILNNNTDYQI